MSLNLFDAASYRSLNSDLQSFSDEQAWSHFQEYGLKEGREFSPFVDLNFYRASNSDLASFSNQELYSHLCEYGVAEGRRFSPFFDLNFYHNQNSDLASFNNEQLFEHLRNHGIAEGRQFSQFVNINYYLAANPDVAEATVNNRLTAFSQLKEGVNQGRSFSDAFDANYYRNTHPELASLSNKQLLENFELFGLNGGQASAEYFDVKYYLSNNSDLANFSYSQAYEHYVTYGLREGRITSPIINSDYAGNTLETARKIAPDYHPVTFKDSVISPDINDFYSFNVGSENKNFNLELKGLSADADVELLNSSGEVITRAATTGIANESLSANIQSGTYYIRVYQGTGGGDTNYSMTISTTPAPATLVSAGSDSATPTSTTPTPATSESSPTPQTASNPFIDKVLELTNSYRLQAGLQALRLNIQLSNAAYSHSEDMAQRDYFDHKGSDGSYAGDRATKAGYQYSYLGENIAAGYTTPEEVVQAWMNSEGHRANILNPNFQEIGIGYYYLENDTGNVNMYDYWTQNFGTGNS